MNELVFFYSLLVLRNLIQTMFGIRLKANDLRQQLLPGTSVMDLRLCSADSKQRRQQEPSSYPVPIVSENTCCPDHLVPPSI